MNETLKPLDMSKPICLSDGRAAEVVGIFVNKLIHPRPLFVVEFDGGARPVMGVFNADGLPINPHEPMNAKRLINAPSDSPPKVSPDTQHKQDECPVCQAAKPEAKAPAFDPKKPVQTRDGRPARIICTDFNNSVYPIIALIKTLDIEMAFEFTANGQFVCNHTGHMDLINVREKIVREFWVNVYKESKTELPIAVTGGFFRDKSYADASIEGGRLACVKVRIECQEGDGLEKV